MGPRRGLVDDRDKRPVSAVEMREEASAEQWHAEDLEEVRRDAVDGQGLLNRLGPTLDREGGRARLTEDPGARGRTGHAR